MMIETLQEIGNEICENCGPDRDCGIEIEDCARINNAIGILEGWLDVKMEEIGKSRPYRKWIDVNNALPEIGEPVLVCWEIDNRRARTMAVIRRNPTRVPGGTYWLWTIPSETNLSPYEYQQQITHWMPLPELP